MMPSRLRALASALVLAGLGLSGSADAARAQTLATTEPCPRYVPGEATFPVAVTGFTPGSVVRFTTADGQLVGTGVTDPAGAFTGTLSAPALSGNRTRQDVVVTASDLNGVTAPPLAVSVVRFTVSLPRRARPTSRVRFRALGFLTGSTVYLHVRRGGRTLGSYRIGTAEGPCGIAERRLRYMPLRRYRTGTYDYVFQPSARYERSVLPTFRSRIIIFRTFRRSTG
jgi:hypothetical protein